MIQIRENIKNEPLALIALVVTVVLSILQSDWFKSLIASKVEMAAYYSETQDGRCSLTVFSIENKTSEEVKDLSVNILTDWIVRQGHETIEVGTRSAMLIGAGEVTPIKFREELNIKYVVETGLVVIPSLLPGQYIDLFLGRGLNSSYDIARQKLTEDSRYVNTPRIALAAYKDGVITVNSSGECLDA